MSLFLGNLSSHVRRDELESVFRRFGRSNVHLKDGYGFVIFDIPSNAEKALRALRGKNICGEPISITWANKQPRPFQRFVRGTRFYEPYHGKNFTRGESYGMRKKGLYRQTDSKTGGKHLDSNSGLPYMVDPLDEELGNHRELVGDDGGLGGEKLLDRGASIAPNPVDNDRWGEPASDPLNDNGVENGTNFDRYEPYHGFDGRDKEENQQTNGFYGSPNRGRSQEKQWKEHSGETPLKQQDTPIAQQTCYGCGLTGHIMCNCPQADTYQQGTFAWFDHRRNDRIGFRGRDDGESKRLRPSSLRRLKSSKDTMMAGQQRTDRVTCGSGKSRKLVRRNGSSPANKVTSRSQPKRNNQGRKRSRVEPGSPKKHHGKMSRQLASHSMHSNSISSSSHSHLWSLKSVSGISSHSRSRSVSSRSCLVSSSSMSSSTSSYSRSDFSRSRSNSGSMSSLSLSISPGQPLPSSPSKAPTMATSASPKQSLKNVHGPENSKRNGAGVPVKDDNTLPYLKVKGKMKKDSHGQMDDYGNHSKSRIGYEQTNLGTTSLEQCTSPADNSSSENLTDERELQKSQPLEHTESPSGKPNPDFPVNLQTNKSTRISSDGMYMVLKHYGLALPEESEKHLPTEVFFGSARLWPWEMIYYRRLKKGPITTENYARRVAQNVEFGIVDKYVRGSSGWGECDNNSS